MVVASFVSQVITTVLTGQFSLEGGFATLTRGIAHILQMAGLL